VTFADSHRQLTYLEFFIPTHPHKIVFFAQIFLYMKFQNPVSVQWLADFTGAKLVGDTTQLATGINEIHFPPLLVA